MKYQLKIPRKDTAVPGRKFSLKRQIVRAGWLFILVIALLLLILQVNFIKSYQKDGDEKRTNDMYVYGQTLETHFNQLLDAVRTIYSENHAFEEIGAYRSPAEKWDNVYELLNTLRIQVNSNQAIGGLFVYYDSYEQVQYAINGDWSLTDLQELKEAGRTVLKSSESIYSTVLLETDEDLLYNIYMKKNTAALGGGISLSQGLPDEKDSTAVYGVIYNGQFYPVWSEAGTDPQSVYEGLEEGWMDQLLPGRNRIDGKIIYFNPLNSADLAVVEILPESIWLYMDRIHVVFMILICLFLLGAARLMYFVYHELSRPLEDMTKALANIKEGVWEVHFSAPNRILEIEDVRHSVKALLGEIEQYKIRFYEEELEKAKIHRQYLQLQLAPHFYTNCLKNAYYMLALKEYDNAEIFLQKLSVHMRYLLQQDAAFVTVEQEIRFVENYVDMQKLMTSKGISCTIAAEETVMDVEIPVLTLQTFVENSVKYARDAGGSQLFIEISAKLRKTEEGNYLDITVRDNGPGYPDELLEVINQENPVEKDDLGVGVINLQKRIRLFYGDRASWYFENRGGAVSELILTEEREVP